MITRSHSGDDIVVQMSRAEWKTFLEVVDFACWGSGNAKDLYHWRAFANSLRASEPTWVPFPLPRES